MYRMDMQKGSRLKNKVCIVTGAGSVKGIGWATVTKFAHEGARHIYIIDIATDELPALTTSLSETCPSVGLTVVKADVADEEAISGVCNRAVAEQGQLDVFFANAGAAASKFRTPFKDLTTEAFMWTLKLNVLSCFLAVKYATVAMGKISPENGKHTGGGSIIFTASTAGSNVEAGAIDYCAGKAAIISLAMNAAYENQTQRNNVRVNAVCPGVIDTMMSSVFMDEFRAISKRSGDAAVVRVGMPSEVANLVAFFASDESSYINGQAYKVDNGLSNVFAIDKVQVE